MSEINYLDELEALINEDTTLVKSIRTRLAKLARTVHDSKDMNAPTSVREEARAKLLEMVTGKKAKVARVQQPTKSYVASTKAAAASSPTASSKKQAEKMSTDKSQQIIDNALHLTHELVQGKNHDLAHKVFSSIPTDALPDELRGYHPHYTHLGISPHMWKALPAEHREATHTFYDEALTGLHDADPTVKEAMARIGALKKPAGVPATPAEPAALPVTTPVISPKPTAPPGGAAVRPVKPE